MSAAIQDINVSQSPVNQGFFMFWKIIFAKQPFFLYNKVATYAALETLIASILKLNDKIISLSVDR